MSDRRSVHGRYGACFGTASTRHSIFNQDVSDRRSLPAGDDLKPNFTATHEYNRAQVTRPPAASRSGEGLHLRAPDPRIMFPEWKML